MDLESMAYIKSESEFSNARLKGFLQVIMGLIRGHNMHLLSFTDVVEKLRLKQSIYLGLQDIAVKNIAGSTGRYEDFTRTFLPRSSDKRAKERWRNIYTRAVTGKGFPPIDVYKIDQVYFVKDGNHRVSVARELGWETVQAFVTELPTPISLRPDVKPDDLLTKGEYAWFLQQTQLDETRPDSKEKIDFSEPGGYQRLLKHIELHRYLMHLEQDPQGDEPISLPDAAADWYDNVFLPMIVQVQESDIISHFPGRSESDLYMWLIRHQARLSEQYNLAQDNLPEMAKEFLESVDR